MQEPRFARARWTPFDRFGGACSRPADADDTTSCCWPVSRRPPACSGSATRPRCSILHRTLGPTTSRIWRRRSSGRFSEGPRCVTLVLKAFVIRVALARRRDAPTLDATAGRPFVEAISGRDGVPPTTREALLRLSRPRLRQGDRPGGAGPAVPREHGPGDGVDATAGDGQAPDAAGRMEVLVERDPFLAQYRLGLASPGR